MAYSAALVLPVLATFVQRSLWRFLPPSPHLFFYPAVVVTAYLGGFAPTLLSVFASSLLISYWFLPPLESFVVTSGQDALDLALFWALAASLGWLVTRTRVALSAAEKDRDEARAAKEFKNTLLAMIAHDLASPVHAIALGADSLTDALAVGADDEVFRTIVGRLQASAWRTKELVKHVREIASVEDGTLGLRLALHTPADLIRDVVELFAAQAESHALVLVGRAQDGLGAIPCDRDRVLQVLSNLVGNAVKFADPRSTVRVAAERRGDEIVFVVENEGARLTPDEAAHLFDRHWHGARAGAGTGLGLFIAKVMTEAHGGSIRVDASRNTAFLVALPIARRRTGPGDAHP